ncbi:hypothetical protein B0A70_01535 [Chryseobacterium piscicola]|uniref:Uncharacterized protein n=1 Tax=Chryseobacterium piscicola TaxID=551459 RepID=A0A2S7KI94_9FLAO|nr:hypothetical protein B0A70_01535 [Chryseobacterium piscicola]
MKTWGIFLFKTLIYNSSWLSQISSWYTKLKQDGKKLNCNRMESIETIDQFSKDSKFRQSLFDLVENEIKLPAKK